MYRAVTYHFMEEAIDLDVQEEVDASLNRSNISFNDKSSIFLNGKNVDKEIRTKEVNERVSEVSTISAVRRKMVAQQQQIGNNKGVVMDGRDIGTVVFPDAELKVFMVAEIEVRAQRRQMELVEKGIDLSLDEIMENLLERDRIDSSRADSPLTKAEDAVEIDTTHITLEEQIMKIEDLAKEMINEN